MSHVTVIEWMRPDGCLRFVNAQEKPGISTIKLFALPYHNPTSNIGPVKLNQRLGTDLVVIALNAHQLLDEVKSKKK